MCCVSTRGPASSGDVHIGLILIEWRDCGSLARSRTIQRCAEVCSPARDPRNFQEPAFPTSLYSLLSNVHNSTHLSLGKYDGAKYLSGWIWKALKSSSQAELASSGVLLLITSSQQARKYRRSTSRTPQEGRAPLQTPYPDFLTVR
jgi:hypothetical protein